MIKTIYGNILDATEDIICHQVNCQGVMETGVAKALYQRWPVVKNEYQWFCRTESLGNPRNLLGKLQMVEVEPGKYVANVFGQFDHGRNPSKKYTDYVALTNVFNIIRNKYAEKSLAFPFGFGCELVNGDWAIILQMIETYFKDMNVTIYQLVPAAA